MVSSSSSRKKKGKSQSRSSQKGSNTGTAAAAKNGDGNNAVVEQGEGHVILRRALRGLSILLPLVAFGGCCRSFFHLDAAPVEGSILSAIRSLIYRNENAAFDVASTSSSDQQHQQEDEDEEGPLPSLDSSGEADLMRQCRYVLAPSSLDGAGWGVFSLVHHQSGDKVQYADMDIPLVDVLEYQRSGLDHLIFNYSWKSHFARSEGMSSVHVMPGPGSLYNHHPTAVNVAPSRPYPPTHHMRDRRTSPSAGANTMYHGRQWHAHKVRRDGEIDILPGRKDPPNYLF